MSPFGKTWGERNCSYIDKFEGQFLQLFLQKKKSNRMSYSCLVLFECFSFVSCDSSYEHNCVLCSELPRGNSKVPCVFQWVVLVHGWVILKFSLVLLERKICLPVRNVSGLRGSVP